MARRRRAGEATARAGLYHRRRTSSRRGRASSTPSRADGGGPWPPRPSRRGPSPHQLSSPRRISSLLRPPRGLRPSMLPLPLPRLALLAARRRPTRGARSALGPPSCGALLAARRRPARGEGCGAGRRIAIPRGGRGAAAGWGMGWATGGPRRWVGLGVRDRVPGGRIGKKNCIDWTLTIVYSVLTVCA